ncbi:MAG: hypothetical protein OEY97_05205 [Nitrospirota bacterium]|nr:hypothetical protein [Nitrospirota bacterium]
MRQTGIGLLTVLYLMLTISALLCVLDHGIALAGGPCHQSSDSSMLGGEAPGDVHSMSGSLCDCLDKLAAHGVDLPRLAGLDGPSFESPAAADQSVPSSADFGVLPARGPPASAVSA